MLMLSSAAADASVVDFTAVTDQESITLTFDTIGKSGAQEFNINATGSRPTLFLISSDTPGSIFDVAYPDVNTFRADFPTVRLGFVPGFYDVFVYLDPSSVNPNTFSKVTAIFDFYQDTDVNVIPVPGTLPLFASGLGLALALIRRRPRLR
jgi:hypothetical protein